MFFTENDFNTTSPELYSDNLKLIIKMIQDYSIVNFDNLMCYSLLYDNWLRYYEILQKETTVIIGASNNQTGNILYGGDWILESTNEDIQNIYFTSNIINYSIILAITISGAQGTTTYIRLNGSTTDK